MTARKTVPKKRKALPDIVDAKKEKEALERRRAENNERQRQIACTRFIALISADQNLLFVPELLKEAIKKRFF